MTAAGPGYVCCTFRGSVLAIDSRTGKTIWRTLTVDDSVEAAHATKGGAKSKRVLDRRARAFGPHRPSIPRKVFSTLRLETTIPIRPRTKVTPCWHSRYKLAGSFGRSSFALVTHGMRAVWIRIIKPALTPRSCTLLFRMRHSCLLPVLAIHLPRPGERRWSVRLQAG